MRLARKTALGQVYNSQIMTVKQFHLLAVLTGILFLAHIANILIGKPSWSVSQFLELASDNSAPAWLSSIILAAAALTAYRSFELAGNHRMASSQILLYSAILLLIMSCDEVAQVHEKLVEPGAFLARTLGISVSETMPNTWLLIGAPVIITVFTVFALSLRKILRYAPGTLRLFVLGTVLIVVGGIIVESTGRWIAANQLWTLWTIEVLLEEGLESAGSLLLGYCFAYWNEEAPKSIQVSLELTSDSSP